MAVQISRAFKDISLSFTRSPITNDVVSLRNEDAIKKSVINLCRTRLTDRFFNELLGTSIEDALFELVGEDIGVSLEEEIKSLLNNFEPRIKLTQVNIEDDIDENGLYITIRYNIVGLPFPEQNIEFLLQPSRI
jgi:phage baseplate assembly protein W|tara:strand:+ start:121 stop:522 length:402 start_codon:yes stop_codon:yes gene_type:complete